VYKQRIYIHNIAEHGLINVFLFIRSMIDILLKEIPVLAPALNTAEDY